MTRVTVDVDISSGRLRGCREDGVETFRGVPYADAPVGGLRFKAPGAVSKWAGIRDAIEAGAVCPQTPSRLRFAMGDFAARQSEDCLNLTIWTPQADNNRRPVLVWLHGGAYMSGAGAIDWYSGDKLAREGDVVVVGINYRLGALGFLFRPDWSSANAGLLDQQAALEWVHANIAAFGGDPGNITLWGQSAGAQSITFLLARPHARRLFRRAILQSSPFGTPPRSPEMGTATADKLVVALGFDASTATEQQLAQVPLDRLLAAQTIVNTQMTKDVQRGGLPAPAFWPVGDGVTAPSPENYFREMVDAAKHVDVVVGSTREEMNVFFGDSLSNAPEPFLDASDHDRLKARRPSGTPMQLYADFCSEQIFINGSIAWAADAARSGRCAYVYKFDWSSPDRTLQSCHCLDLPFVFGTRSSFYGARMLDGADVDAVDGLSAAMRASWIGFAQNGNPNHSFLPYWPHFDDQNQATMHFDDVCMAQHTPPVSP